MGAWLQLCSPRTRLCAWHPLPSRLHGHCRCPGFSDPRPSGTAGRTRQRIRSRCPQSRPSGTPRLTPQASQRRTSSVVTRWVAGSSVTTLLVRRRPTSEPGEPSRSALPESAPPASCWARTAEGTGAPRAPTTTGTARPFEANTADPRRNAERVRFIRRRCGRGS